MRVLTAKEKAWIARLQKCLDQCPSKMLAAYTVGDNDITLYDSSLDTEIEIIMSDPSDSQDFCKVALDLDAIIQVINFPFPVHSTAG
jgi:hypothetical protein